MKTNHMLLSLTAALLASTVTVLYAEDTQTTGNDQSAAKPHHKKFDKDGDGKLSDAEKAARKAHMDEMIKKFDKDGDGKLSDSEQAEMKKAHEERMKNADKNGDGKLSDAEKHMLKKFDKDGNGKLSDTERSEMKKEIQEKRKNHQKDGNTGTSTKTNTTQQ